MGNVKKATELFMDLLDEQVAKTIERGVEHTTGFLSKVINKGLSKVYNTPNTYNETKRLTQLLNVIENKIEKINKERERVHNLYSNNKMSKKQYERLNGILKAKKVRYKKQQNKILVTVRSELKKFMRVK